MKPNLNLLRIIHWVLFNIISLGFFLQIAFGSTPSSNYLINSIKWETCNSPQMQISISYPESLKIHSERPETPMNEGMEMSLSALKIFRITIHRIYDKDDSKKMLQERFEKDNTRNTFKKSILQLGKNSLDTAIEFSFVNNNFKGRYFYCLNKGLRIIVDYYNYSSSKEISVTPIINYMLSTLIINGNTANSLGCSNSVIEEYLNKLKDSSLDNKPDSNKSLRADFLNAFYATCGTSDSVVLNKITSILENDKYANVRSTAAEIIGHIDQISSHYSFVSKALKSAIHDPDLSVRFYAASDLINFGLADTNEIADLMIDVANNFHSLTSISDRCEKCLLKHDMLMRKEAIKILGKIKNEKAKLAIQKLVNNQDPEISDGATKELNSWGGK
jgi:hypothetical protein